MANQLSSDEQYFPNHDLGGPYFTDHQETWEKWNPARFTANWSTPMLVIHNELDYRLPISEGLAMFNVLQEKGIESRFLTFPDEYDPSFLFRQHSANFRVQKSLGAEGGK